MVNSWEYKLRVVNCSECGKEFRPSYFREKQCSDTCKNIRYARRVAHPSKYTGSFLNETEFNKAWEEAKQKDIWHKENVLVNTQPLKPLTKFDE